MPLCTPKSPIERASFPLKTFVAQSTILNCNSFASSNDREYKGNVSILNPLPYQEFLQDYVKANYQYRQ